MRLALNVLGMFVFGAAALVAAGLLHHARVITPLAAVGRPPQPEQHPMGTSGRVPPAAEPTGAPLHQLTAGVSHTLQAAAAELDAGRRREGVVALDAAYRLSDVLRGAVERGSLADVFGLVQAARTALDDGDGRQAAAIARTAAAVATTTTATPARTPADLGAFVGAAALSPAGDRLGDVVAVHSDVVEIESGGVRGILGFIDFSPGVRRRVSMDHVVFGTPRTIGMTMVVVSNR